jgi:hypothetical protein
VIAIKYLIIINRIEIFENKLALSLKMCCLFRNFYDLCTPNTNKKKFE